MVAVPTPVEPNQLALAQGHADEAHLAIVPSNAANDNALIAIAHSLIDIASTLRALASKL